MSIQNNTQLAFSDINSQLRVTGGNVGIGSTAPAYKLDVIGDINFTGNLYIPDPNSKEWVQNASNIYYTTGNIGIGTVPNDLLHVSGNTLIGRQIIKTNYTRLGTNGNYAILPTVNGMINGVNITSLARRTSASNRTQEISVNTWTTSTLPGSSTWISVVWAAEIGLFCAIAMGGTTAATSSDGITWTSQTLPASANWNSITWAAELGTFCAIANGSASAATSPDGITWTSQTLPSSNSWVSVVWAAEIGLFCAVASGPSTVAATSPDGITWSSQTLPISDNWSSVTWSPELGLFCAVSSGTSTAVSSDGITWTSGTMMNSRSWSSVAWSPELGTFCAVSVNSSVCTVSLNGITWSEQTMPSLSDWSSVIWAPELRLFCAVSVTSGTTAATSSDGIIWTTRSLPTTTSWQSITWSPELSVFCVVATGSNVAAISNPTIPTGMNTLLAPISQLSINSAGNVAIGTTSPSANRRLTVSGLGTDMNNAVEIEILNTSFTSANLRLGVVNTAGAMMTNSVLGAGIITNDWGHLQFGTGTGGSAQTRLIITTGGNVGIGTVSPENVIDINNSTNNSGSLRLAGSNVDGAVIRMENTDINGRIYHMGSTASGSGAGIGWSVYDVTGNDIRIMVNSSQNVGFGTSNPSFKADVVGSLAATSITTGGMFSTNATVSNMFLTNITRSNWSISNFLIDQCVISTSITGSNIYITENINAVNSTIGTLCAVNLTTTNLSSSYITSANVLVTSPITIQTISGTTFTGENMSLSGDYYKLNSNFIETFNSTDRLETDLTVYSMISSVYTGGSLNLSNNLYVANSTIANLVSTTSSVGNSFTPTYTGGSLQLSNTLSAQTSTVSNIVFTSNTIGTLVTNRLLSTSSTLGSIISDNNNFRIVGNLANRVRKMDYNRQGTTGSFAIPPAAAGLVNGVNVTTINKRIRYSNSIQRLSTSVWSIRTTSLGSNTVWASELGIFCSASGSQSMISSDGINWTSYPIPSGFFVLVWAPELGLFCGVHSSNNNIAITSPDGITWTTSALPANGNWSHLVWAPELGLFCACVFNLIGNQTSNIAATSPDGITWTQRDLNLTNQYWSRLVWSPELKMFLALGHTTQYVTSSDGITWTPRTLPSTYLDVAWSSELGLFCAVRVNGAAISTDGINWTTHSFESSVGSVRNLVWISQLSLFCYTIDNNTNFMISRNGVNWTSSELPTVITFGGKLIFSEELGILLMTNNSRYFTSRPLLQGSMNIVKSSQGNLVIGSNIGKSDYALLNTSANYAISPVASGFLNGVNVTALNRRTRASNRTQDLSVTTWTTRTLPSSSSWNSVCWAAELGIFCAVSSTSGTVAATSPDGITWTIRTLPATSTWYSVVWAAELGIFCAVGGTTAAATSPDGITWTSRTLPSSGNWRSVVWAPELNLFCAVQSGSTAAATSRDGINWTARTLPSSSNWWSIVWSAELGLFCAVSSTSGTVAATSPDGTTWTSRTLSTSGTWTSVAWSAELGLFCAVSNTSGTTASTSPDGITWTTRTLPSNSTWQSVTWAPELGLFCVVSSASGTVAATSQDGINWTSRTLPTTATWQSIVWAAELGIFCVVASGGTSAATSLAALPMSMNTVKAPASHINVDATFGNLTLTTSLRATNNSNTVGNIFTTGGNVGIGTTAPGYLLELDTDSAAKPTTNTWTVSSDSRLKTGITLANLETCYNNVKALPLKRYTWRDDVYTPEQVPDRSKLGWIAQDVETVIPKAVEQHEQHGLPDCRSLNSDQIIASLYGCVQKLTEKVETLETERTRLQNLRKA